MNGAVASTVIAGVELMKRGLAPRIGMVTERTDARIAESITELLDFAPLESLVFARLGPAVRQRVRGGAAPQGPAAARARPGEGPSSRRSSRGPPSSRTTYVEKRRRQERRPRRAATARRSRSSSANLEAFKKAHKLDRVVMVNLASTERFLEVQPVHKSARAPSRPASTRTTRRSRRRCGTSTSPTSCGIPYCNFTPSLTNVPALDEPGRARRATRSPAWTARPARRC